MHPDVAPDGAPPARLMSWPEAMLIAGLVVASLFLLAAGAYLLRYGVPAASRYGVVLGQVVKPTPAEAQHSGRRAVGAGGSWIVITSTDDASRIAVQADERGRFRVKLPPGSYVLRARSSQERLSAQERRIEVLGGQALNPRLSLSAPLWAASAGQLPR